MAASPLEDDQDIAENIQSRIFYEEATHERVLHLLRTYKDQGLGYLDACTELTHVFIRMLEQYSKQNVDLHIRSRRRARKKKRAAQAADGVEHTGGNDDDVDDIEEVQVVSRERKFDFARFVARFMTQASVDTFVHLTKYYKDLSKEQLKRAHRFFYRVAFKNELSVMLFRVDIIQLFHTMIKGPNGLDPELPAFKEWSDFSQQLFRRLIKRLEDRPGLYVELLFSKIPATTFYLEHGYDNKVEKAPRPPAELEVKPGMEWHQEIGVVVSILINQNKSDSLAWLKKIMLDAKDERQAWQDLEIARKAVAREAVANAAESAEGAISSVEAEDDSEPRAPSILVRPDTGERRKALFKDNKLRLLMTLCGFKRLGDTEDPEASWVIPTSVEPAKLEEAVKIINGHEFDPPTFEDERTAESFLRSKAAAERAMEKRVRTAAFDDDSDNGIDFDEEFEFEAGGPTNRKSELEKLKKTRKIRRRKEVGSDDEEDGLSEEMRKKRRDERRLAELEKRRKIKSEMYVHSSDDATDEERDKEFFAQEEVRRQNAGSNFLKALESGSKELARESTKKRKSTAGGKKGAKKKRKGGDSVEGSDDEMASPVVVSDDDEQPVIAISSEEESSDAESDVASNDGAEATDTPVSSQARAPSPAVDKEVEPTTTSSAVDVAMKDVGDDSEEDLPVRQPVRRRAGFVVESDSE
jgi:replication fork protection complex subunit Tof1/Swi1